MTTIAWDGRVLACDSRWCDGDEGYHVITRTKITRLPSGALYGASGSSDDRELIAMLSKVKKVDQLPTLTQLGTIRQDLCALLVLPNRKAYIIDTCHISPGEPEASECGVTEYDAPCVTGSGGKFALAVMKSQVMHGRADAYEAVRIACDLDPNSKAPVYRLTLSAKRMVGKKRK